jgi:hypothetical protein
MPCQRGNVRQVYSSCGTRTGWGNIFYFILFYFLRKRKREYIERQRAEGRDICTDVVTSVMWGTYQIIETRGMCVWEVAPTGLTGAMPPCCAGCGRALSAGWWRATHHPLMAAHMICVGGHLSWSSLQNRALLSFFFLFFSLDSWGMWTYAQTHTA